MGGTLLLVLMGLASAAEPEFVGTNEEDAAEKPESSLTAEVGGSFTTGNTFVYTISSGITGHHKWKRSKLSLVGGTLIGASIADQVDPTSGVTDGTISDAEKQEGYVKNAERYFADARYDIFISEKDSFYFLAGAFRDTFAGYQLRAHEQLGYSRQLVANDNTTLRGELGFDVAQEFRTSETDSYETILAAKIGIAFSQKLGENSKIENSLEVFENVQTPADLRLLNTFAFVTSLSDKFSLKLGHALIFDNLPVEGFRPLDQTTTVTLVASIL